MPGIAQGATMARLMINDDGWLMSANEPPLTPEIFRQQMVGTYAGTPVDTLLWSIGGGQVHHYETEVGELFGDGYEESELDEASLRRYHNIRSIMKTDVGPLTALTKVAHDQGLKLFPSVRINNHYEVDHDAPNFSRIRRDHPEWLIGYGEELTPNSNEWGIREGMNFSVPEVREHIVAVVCEMFEKFDVDGIELDFQRHPGMFAIEQGFSSRHLITDMVSQIRTRMTAANGAGRNVELIARVPETIADAARLGMDTVRWIDEGLVDGIVVGGGFIPFDMKIEEYVEAAGGTGTKVYGCVESLRPTASDETIRGVASRIHDAGADGLYLFNYFSRSPEWKQRVLGEIASPASMVGKDKRYEIDHIDRVVGPGTIGGAFRHGLPPLQLPATLAAVGLGPMLRLNVADNPAIASETTLRLRLERFESDDRLEVKVNGTRLDWESASVQTTTWDHPGDGVGAREVRVNWKRAAWFYREIDDVATEVEFAVDPTNLRHRENDVRVSLVRDSDSTAPVILRDVELDVRFS